jgi:hypothetical protein
MNLCTVAIAKDESSWIRGEFETNAMHVAEVVSETKTKSTNLTLYHINPLEYPDDPVNMNLADVNGELFFDMFEIFQVFWCNDPNAPPPPPGRIRCPNPEYAGKDIGVTQLVVEISSSSINHNRLYGPYSMCNICQNQSSPVWPSHTCKDGEYVCDCFGGLIRPKHKLCTNPAVGRKRIYWFGQEQQQWYGRKILPDSYDHDSNIRDDDEWTKSILGTLRAAKRTWGFWYSMLDIGEGKTWRKIGVTKKITKACHAASFVTAIQDYSKQNNNNITFDDCLWENCQVAPVNNTTNTTVTPCWAQCFADMTLGPNATSLKGYTGGGMGRNQLVEAWSRPFRSEDPSLGGCPDIRRSEPGLTSKPVLQHESHLRISTGPQLSEALIS